MTHNKQVHVFKRCFSHLVRSKKHPTEMLKTTDVVTWSIVQKMWASSCWKRRTLVSPVSVPDNSFLCRTPKSASLSGSSRHERGLWLNIRLQENQIKITYMHEVVCVILIYKSEKEKNTIFLSWELYIYQCPGQFIGFRANMSSSTEKENIFSL